MKTLHSFRHTVASCLMEQDVQEFMIAMLLGHKHSQITSGRYGKRLDPQKMMEQVVSKIKYEI